MMQLQGSFYDEMVAQGLEEFPNESCGLIAGEAGAPVRVYPMRNADASPVTYRFDPKQQLEVTEEIEDKGWDLLAIYHTHTHSEAYPSETDRRQAFYPEAWYLVLSLADRDRPVLRAFRIVDGEIAEEELEIA